MQGSVPRIGSAVAPALIDYHGPVERQMRTQDLRDVAQRAQAEQERVIAREVGADMKQQELRRHHQRSGITQPCRNYEINGLADKDTCR